MVNLNELKVPQLKSFAKNLKLTRYSRLRKNDLVALISKQFEKTIHQNKQKKHKINELKVPQLKSFAKNLKLTRYSRLRKNDLVALINKHFEKTIHQNKQKKHKKKFLRRKEKRAGLPNSFFCVECN